MSGEMLKFISQYEASWQASDLTIKLQVDPIAPISFLPTTSLKYSEWAEA